MKCRCNRIVRTEKQSPNRYEEPVGTYKVREVMNSPRRTWQGSFLSNGGVRDQSAVVAHPEDLVGERDYECPRDHSCSTPPRWAGPFRPAHNRDEHNALDQQFWSHEKAHAQEHKAEWGHVLDLRAAPANQECEAASEPQEHQSRLQPGCCERPNRRQCHKDCRTQWEKKAVRCCPSDKLAGTHQRDRNSSQREHDAGDDGDPRQGKTRGESKKRKDRGPGRTGHCLDALALVEYGTMSSQYVLHYVW